MKPYWEGDDGLVLYLGDCREVLPALGVTAELVLADPPYGETSLPWDRWPDGWLDVAATATRSLWCFGSLRMFMLHSGEFTAAGWRMSQDIVWEKQNGTGLSADRFRRVHEVVSHWYVGQWRDRYHDTPREQHHGRNEGSRYCGANKGEHLGAAGNRLWSDDGTRLMRSIIRASNTWRRSLHPTEKPIGLLDPLIRYACPPNGLVVDPFAGSGSTLDAARSCGRRAIGVEGHEPYAEAAARRLDQMTLEVG